VLHYVRAIAVAALVLGMGWGASALAASQPPDRIVLISGKEIRDVRIVDADITGVSYVRYTAPEGTTPLKVKREEISEISWGDAGLTREVVNQLKTGHPDEALRKLKQTPETGQVRKQYPKCYYALEALQGELQALMALNEFAKVPEVAAALDPQNAVSNPVKGEPYGKIWQLRGHDQMASAYVRLKQLNLADDNFKVLAQVTELLLAAPPDEMKPYLEEISGIQQRALVGRAEVLTKTDPAKAVEWIEKIKDKITDKAARMKMHMCLGELLMSMAEKQGDQEAKKVKYKEAMLAFMRVYILYPEQKEFRAQAMLKAAQTSNMLSTPSDNARAGRIAKELLTEFPNAPEAKDARTLLEALGMKAP
jgi:hypothetical protein